MSDAFWVCVIDSAFRCSVPLFVMISAYLLVPVKGDASVFFKKRLVRVVIPFIVWSVLYATLPYLWGGMTGAEVESSLVRLTYNFNNAGGHMWFVYMLIGLYLFMPVISPWLEKAGKKAELMFIALWIMSSFFPYLRDMVGEVYGECFWNEYNLLWYFSGFLGYVVLAHFIRYHLTWSVRKQLVVGAVLYLVGYYFTATIWYDRIPTSADLPELELSWRFCTPNIIAMGFGAFMVFKALFSGMRSESRVIKEISALSYGIYLMHIFILGKVYGLVEGLYSTPVTILLVGVITLASCFAICKIISYLPYSKYIVG